MNIKRTTHDLIDSLKEQHAFLKQSCELYDNGSENEAKRIALCLRILLHDTTKSQSILEQLNIKGITKFIDTAHPYKETNLMPSSYLTLMRFTNNSDTVLPRLKKYKNFPHEHKQKKFDCWWKQIVLDDKRHQFSRKDIVLLTANKDGGAHVNSELPAHYHDLTRENSMGWIVRIGVSEKPLKNFCFASIRQIGFEVDLALDALNIDLWSHQSKP